MMRNFVALIILVAFGCEASSDTLGRRPRLKETVAVSSEIVRIGDIVGRCIE